jgi:Mrp family chromosome partitioning ATPase
MNASTTAEAVANLEEAERFLAALDPETSVFTFQTFDDDQKRKNPKLVRVLHGALAEHATELRRLNDLGAGIFVTVNRTDGKGRKAANIVAVRAVYADLDGAPLEPVLASDVQPHIVTETSPGRWHAFWRVADLPLDQFTSVQKTLIERFGSDPAVSDLPRVMRLPGFVHCKTKDAPFVSRIERVRDGAPFTAADFPRANGKIASSEQTTAAFSDAVAKLAQQHAGDGVSENPADYFGPATPEKIEAALDVVSADCDNLTWYRVGSALHRELGDEVGFALFDKWSKKSKVKYTKEDCAAKWKALVKNPPTRIGVGTIFYLADQADAGWRSRYEQATAQTTPIDDAKPAVATDGKAIKTAAAKSQRAKRLDTLLNNAADLQTMTFEPLRWIVPMYLPEGLTVLAGKPKIGKSFLALDVAAAVASGGMCLGKQCEAGDVLALFLEDSKRRLQRRLTTMLGAQKEQWPARPMYATEWARLAEGGLEDIRHWIGSVPKPRLVIIDILERVRTHNRALQKTQYAADYEALAALQSLATEQQLSILVLHHQRKMGAEDLIDTVSGTLGLGGAVDAFQILGKDEGGHFLYGRGRDLEAFAVAVQQDAHCCWQVLGPKADAQASPERGRIVAVLAKAAGKTMTVEEIAAAVGMKKANVKNLLSKLHFEHEIERVATGVYKIADPQTNLGLDEVF